MKKQDAKLPPPKKLALADYEIMQTLGMGKDIIDEYRVLWKSKTSKGEEDEEVFGNQDAKESRDHQT